jgi:hypothetical protein
MTMEGTMPADALELAIWAVSYWLSEMTPSDSIQVDFSIDRHPCDDLPYLANLSVWGHDGHALIDGDDGG